MLGVALDEGDVRLPGGAVARELEQLRDTVDADHLAHERCERKRERACPGADVERPLVAARQHERVHDAGERRGTLVLMRCHLRSGAREAVRHRRRCGGLVEDCC